MRQTDNSVCLASAKIVVVAVLGKKKNNNKKPPFVNKNVAPTSEKDVSGKKENIVLYFFGVSCKLKENIVFKGTLLAFYEMFTLPRCALKKTPASIEFAATYLGRAKSECEV